jgi:hypothetical protein
MKIQRAIAREGRRCPGSEGFLYTPRIVVQETSYAVCRKGVTT